MSLRFCLLSCFIALIFSSCSQETTEFIPDVSNLDPKINFIRFDQEVSAIDTNKITADLKNIEFKYPVFTDLYFDRIVLLNPENRAEDLASFLKDERIQFIQDTSQMILGSLDNVKDDLYQSLQYFQYYFPDKELPNIYTFISEYSYQAFIFNDVEKDGIGLGLDMFLGNDYPYRKFIPNNPAFSEYLTRSFNKDHMAKKAIETLVEDLLGQTKGNTLLDKMIHNGKKIYIMDRLMPFVSDTVIMEYSQKQLDWCLGNEVQMWGYLFSENLFYSNDLQKINKLINPSPHSSGMPEEAPGRTANFIGWQIIKAYMARNPDKDLNDLISDENAQEILELSKYKPRNR